MYHRIYGEFLVINMAKHISKAKQLYNISKAQKLEDHERQKCEVWTRCMGYFRPVDNFNEGKKSEFNERKCFKEEKGKDY